MWVVILIGQLESADYWYAVSPWATSTRVQDLERKVAMIKADLFCELIAVRITFASPVSPCLSFPTLYSGLNHAQRV